MDKRYQVFVSSTYEDLKDERSKVIQALLNFDCIPCGMEYFPATDEDAWKCIERLIPECDYYVVILGGMYGSIPPKREKSYTHLEYELAVKHKVPVIGLLHRSPSKISQEWCEKTTARRKKLARFRAQVEQKLCRYWETPDQLAAELLPSLREQQNRCPRIGWVRADTIADDEAKTQIIKLQRELDKREKQMEEFQGEELRAEQNLARGSDEFAFSAKWAFWNYEKRPEQMCAKLDATTTWDALVRFIRDSLGTDWARHQLREKICKELLLQLPKQGDEEGDSRIQIDELYMDAIEVQLVALGLCVQRSKGWSFTAKGLKYASHMSAIKKGQRSRLSPESFLVSCKVEELKPVSLPVGWML